MGLLMVALLIWLIASAPSVSDMFNAKTDNLLDLYIKQTEKEKENE